MVNVFVINGWSGKLCDNCDIENVFLMKDGEENCTKCNNCVNGFCNGSNTNLEMVIVYVINHM